MADKKVSAFSDKYKTKSSIDPRALRAHRRSIEWKQMRDVTYNQMRDIPLSPLQESDLDKVTPTSGKTKAKAGGSTVKRPEKTKSQNKAPVADPRRAMLEKWKAEKELKKKIEAQNRSKKASFKITHTSSDILDYKRPLQHLPNVEIEAKKSKESKVGVRPQTRSCSTGQSTKNASKPPPSRDSHRLRDGKTVQQDKKNQQVTKEMNTGKPKPAGPSRQTRSSSSAVRPAATSRSVGQSAKCTKTVETKRAQKPQAEMKGAIRSTRSSRTSQSQPPPKTASKATTTSTRNPVSGPASSKHITCTRGSRGGDEPATKSFAPGDFEFNAPGNLPSFAFKPLTPKSSAAFLRPSPASSVEDSISPPSARRCSTPKQSKGRGGGAVSKPPTVALIEQVSSSTGGSGSSSEGEKDLTNSHQKGSRSRAATPYKAAPKAATTSSSDEDPPMEGIEGQDTKPSTRSRKSHAVVGEQSEESSDRAKPQECTEDGVDEDSHPGRGRRRRSRAPKSTGNESISSPAPKRVTRRSVAQASSSETSDAEGVPRALSASLPTVPEPMETDTKPQEEQTDQENVAQNVVDGPEANPTPLEPMEAEVTPQEGHADKENTAQSQGAAKGPLRDEDVFLTPRESKVLRRAPGTRPRSMSADLPRRSQKKLKTPRLNRTSLILSNLSPEEGVEVLLHSPMIEMKRKTPKHSTSVVDPLPTFDEESKLVQQLFDQFTETESTNPPTDGQGESKSSGSVTDEASGATVSTTEPESSSEENMATKVEGSEPSSGENMAAKVEGSELSSEANTATKMEGSEPSTGANTAAKMEESAPKEEEHDVPYFRNLLASETSRLTSLCDKWNRVNEENADISEEVRGQLRTTVGQAQLLMNQRFKQFMGLVDNCEFNLGEKETTCTDLQGFWDMIYFQVEDVDVKFENLDKLQKAGWKVDKPAMPKKKIIKKKPVAGKTGKTGPPARSKFAEFRARMKAQAQQGAEEKPCSPAKTTPAKEEVPVVATEETKTFDAGFFSVSSPVNSPKSQPNSQGASPSQSLHKSRHISRHNTPLGGSPFLRAVLDSSLRRSLSKRSPLSRSPLLADIQSKHRHRSEGKLGGDVEMVPEEGEMKEIVEEQVNPPEGDLRSTPRRQCRTSARRSVRLSNVCDGQLQESSQRENIQSVPDADMDSFAKYLVPSVTSATPESKGVQKENKPLCFSPALQATEMSSPSPATATGIGRLTLDATESPHTVSTPSANTRKRAPSLLFTPESAPSPSRLTRINENAEDIPICHDLISLSPLPSSQAPTSHAAVTPNRNTPRRSTRKSVASLL